MISDSFIPQSLVSRDAELQRICEILAEDGDFLLVGTPGTGRRTLLRQAAYQVNARLMQIDCLRSTSASQFLRLLADSLMDCFSRSEDVPLLQAWAIDQPLTIEKSADDHVRFVWHLPPSKEWLLFETLLDLPQRLAEQLDCRVVLVFQNFPHMRTWDRQGRWEAHLRQEIQRQNRVSYALVATVAEPWVYASKLHVVHLPPLSHEALRPWLIETMAAKGLYFDCEKGVENENQDENENGAIALFLNSVQGHLGHAIALARRIWLDHHAYSYPDATIQAHHVHRSLLALVEDMAVTFESLILLLPPSQVRVLESLALDPTDSPQSRTYIKKHQLSRGGGLQGALNSLEQKGLIYGPHLGYQIALPLLKVWLRQRLA